MPGNLKVGFLGFDILDLDQKTPTPKNKLWRLRWRRVQGQGFRRKEPWPDELALLVPSERREPEMPKFYYITFMLIAMQLLRSQRPFCVQGDAQKIVGSSPTKV
jgi:hypothetical protein